MAGVAQSIQAHLGDDEPGCSYWSPLTTAATSAHGLSNPHIQLLLASLTSTNNLRKSIPFGPKFHLESRLSDQIHTMVIFGGLELVAAGVILHKYNKGKEQERELEREQERRARERRHNRKHHHRRDSPSRHPHKDQSLYPQQCYIPRPQSAPPPRYSPSWQPQTTYYPPQPWQPLPKEKTPVWQPQTQPNYQPPVWQAQAPPQSQSQQQQQPQPARYPTTLHDDAALSELLRRRSLNGTSSETAPGRTQPRPTAVVPPPDPNYAELSGDVPRPHTSTPRPSPHVAFALPGDELHSVVGQRDPPPAYQPYIPE